MTNTAPRFTLRPYQQDCLTAIERSSAAGVKRQAFSIPTGGGKTVIFSHLPQKLNSSKRWLFVAHREELLEQTLKALENVYGPNSAAIEQAGRSAGRARFVVASVASIGRGKGNRRLLSFNPHEFDGVVFDECHHAAAQSYVHVYNHFKQNPDLLTIGCSATLNRTDGVGLQHLFDKIVYQTSIQDLIKNGFLVPIHAFLVRTQVNLNKVKTHMGDFAQGELGKTVDIHDRNAAIVKGIMEHTPDKAGVVFAASLEHAKNLSGLMNAKGLKTDVVYGDMHPDDRKKALERFRNGDLKWLTNYGILTEGTDLPMIEVLVMARPTKSKLLFTQMLGRGLRLSPGKTQCSVLDIVDICGNNAAITTPSLFGKLPSFFDCRGKDVLKTYRAIEQIQSQSGRKVDISDVKNIDDVTTRLEKIHVFDLKQVSGVGNLTWFEARGSYCASVNRDKITANLKVSPIAGSFVASVNGNLVSSCATMQEAVKKAELAAQKLFGDNNSFKALSETAAWRKNPATPNQIGLLSKLGAKFDARNITKGEASDLISKFMTAKSANR